MRKEEYELSRKIAAVRRAVTVLFLVLGGAVYLASGRENGRGEVRILYGEERTPASEAYGTEDGSQTMGTAAVFVSEDGTVSAADQTGPGTSSPESPEAKLPAGRDMADPTGTGKAETEAEPPTAAPGIRDGLVNLNTASAAELETLPGIGPKTAELILAYREQYGGFASPEELKNVKRIGDKTYEKLRDRITV